MNENSKLIGGIVAMTVLVFVGFVYLLVKAPSDTIVPNIEVTFNDTNAPTLGKEDSKVVVRLDSDFQCPACKLSEPLVQQIIAAYKDRVKFIWKDFPLMQIHAHAREAANAARCAQDQGKFWEYHDKLYETQEGWAAESNPKDRFVQFAQQVGLNQDTFQSCYNKQANDDKVMADVEEGLKNEVDRTPTVFVNQQRLFPTTFEAWKQVIDAELAKAAQPAATSTSTTATSTR